MLRVVKLKTALFCFCKHVATGPLLHTFYGHFAASVLLQNKLQLVCDMSQAFGFCFETDLESDMYRAY